MSQSANAIISAIPEGIIRLASRNQWRHKRLRQICKWGASLIRGRDGVILHGVGRGLRFNVGSSNSGFLFGSHEPGVQEVLETALKPGMVYYDVGANVGFFAVIAARLLGPTGRVICFEPLPANAQQIEYNAQLNHFSQISVRCEALGDSDRTECFQTSAEPTWGMLATVGTPDKHSGQIHVNVRKVDSLSGAGGLPDPDLIKIDVEGAETDVLAGAVATISASRPLLLIELHGTNDAVAAGLEDLNYQPAVLGSSIRITDARWDAYVIAAPREGPELMDVMMRVSRGSNVR